MITFLRITFTTVACRWYCRCRCCSWLASWLTELAAVDADFVFFSSSYHSRRMKMKKKWVNRYDRGCRWIASFNMVLCIVHGRRVRQLLGSTIVLISCVCAFRTIFLVWFLCVHALVQLTCAEFKCQFSLSIAALICCYDRWLFIVCFYFFQMNNIDKVPHMLRAEWIF